MLINSTVLDVMVFLSRLDSPVISQVLQSNDESKVIIYPLVNVYSLRHRKWPIEIVDLPNLKMVIFHSFLLIYQAG